MDIAYCFIFSYIAILFSDVKLFTEAVTFGTG